MNNCMQVHTYMWDNDMTMLGAVTVMMTVTVTMTSIHVTCERESFELCIDGVCVTLDDTEVKQSNSLL